MIGCRQLTKEEISALKGVMSPRDAAILILGVKTGFRISEILSLNICDVLSDGKVRDVIKVHKRNMKGQTSGRAMVVHRDAKNVLQAYLDGRDDKNPLAPAFTGKRGRLGRTGYHRCLKEAAYESKIKMDNVATHSSRKTFAQAIYNATGRDLFKTQRAMGHISINNTIKYLAIDEEEISKLVLTT